VVELTTTKLMKETRMGREQTAAQGAETRETRNYKMSLTESTQSFSAATKKRVRAKNGRSSAMTSGLSF
jgi:hypothetical protein